MPFTPFHWGPALLVGLLVFPGLDLAALVVSSVAVDIEPLLVLTLGLHYPLHGFLHTYLGATIVGLVVAVGLWFLRDTVSGFVDLLRISQESSFRKTLLTSLFAIYVHVFLDSLLYPEMSPLYPLDGNPFLYLLSSAQVYGLCTISFVPALGLYIVRAYQHRMT